MGKPVDPLSLISTPEEDANPVDRREVLPEDVLPYAKKACRSCWGKGIFHRIVPPPKGSELPAVREEVLCHCAQKGFIKANMDKLDIDFGPGNAGKMWWRDPVKNTLEGQ